MDETQRLQRLMLGKPILYRKDEGPEPHKLRPGVIVGHDGDGMVDLAMFPTALEGIRTMTLLGGIRLLRNDQGIANSCFMDLKPLSLGSDVMFRATKGELLDPKYPPHIKGVLVGKVVEVTPQPPGSQIPFTLSVMLFSPRGPVTVAHGVIPVPCDLEEPSTCWVEP